MAKKIEVTEERVLRWPDGVDRTFIKLRKPNKAWKKSWKELTAALAEELERLGATGSILNQERRKDQLERPVGFQNLE